MDTASDLEDQLRNGKKGWDGTFAVLYCAIPIICLLSLFDACFRSYLRVEVVALVI